MSHYHASEVERAFQLCDEHSLTKPSIYQGLYNPFNRLVEKELVPLLHENHCSFIAYNPLVAGLLTGKHRRVHLEEGSVTKGRFKDNPNYMPRFFTEAHFDGLEILQAACEKENVSLVEATIRWLLRHSALEVEHGDGVVLGFSSIEHLEENLMACEAASTLLDPLPQSILDAFDRAWSIVQDKDEVFPYWRSYSSDMPNRENLDHGASYSANKAK